MRISVTALLLTTSLIAAGGASVAVRAASNDSRPAAVKDQSRMPSDPRLAVGNDYSGALVQLAQAARAPMPPGPPPMPREGDFDPYGPRDPMGPGGEPFRGPPMMAMHGPGPFGPVPPNRTACDEDINRHAAMAGYIKSKLQLQGSQKDAWRKIEEAAEPAVDRLRQVCALLPVKAGPPPSLPDGIEIAAKQLAARAAFLQAVSGPAHALYETLSPDQRAALVPPPPTPPRLL